MPAIKSQQAPAFLKSLDARISAILVHGTDPGQVSEIAKLAADRLAARDDPPGEVLRVEDGDLEDDPDRLAVELQTVAMFGGRRVVRASASRRVSAKALEPLFAGPALAGALVVEAGSLRADDALRLLFERSAVAAAIACYGDEARDIDALVREVLGAAGLEIEPEARQMLIERLGADRVLSRGELEKLALYAQGRTRIEADDVAAIVGDASELAIDKVLLAAASGDGARAVFECDRAIASGESPQSIIVAAQRYFHRLDRVRAGLDAGRPLDDAIRQLRPPVHFKQRGAFEGQCRTWSAERLAQARSRITEATRSARLMPALETAHTERLLLELARLARVGQARRG
jgi:DNA polymerase-3 subunit delta